MIEPHERRDYAKFVESLKAEFVKEIGYDPDDDPGYFQEFLTEKLWRIAEKKGEV